MKNNRIRLTESQLNRVIRECVKRVLKEDEDYLWGEIKPQQFNPNAHCKEDIVINKNGFYDGHRIWLFRATRKFYPYQEHHKIGSYFWQNIDNGIGGSRVGPDFDNIDDALSFGVKNGFLDNLEP